MCVAFVDLQAHDNVEINAVRQSLRKQGVASQYVDVLREANSGCSTDVSLLSSPVRVRVQKDVKQGDNRLSEALHGTSRENHARHPPGQLSRQLSSGIRETRNDR